MKLHGTMAIKDNTLYIGGVSTVELAKNIKHLFTCLMKN